MLLSPPTPETHKEPGLGKGGFSQQDFWVYVCVSVQQGGAGSTSEPGIYTAPRWQLWFILSERIINLFDRMMYSKHPPSQCRALPAVRMSGVVGTVLSSVWPPSIVNNMLFAGLG